MLILTTFDLDEYVYAALRAGASGFLLKDTPPTDLLAGIRVVAGGDALLAPSVTRQLIGEFARRPESDRPPPAALDVITDREREVLTLVARGWSNAEIAERLYLSAATAKTHVGRLLMKLRPATAPSSWSSPTKRAWSPPARRPADRPAAPATPARTNVVVGTLTTKECGHRANHHKQRCLSGYASLQTQP